MRWSKEKPAFGDEQREEAEDHVDDQQTSAENDEKRVQVRTLDFVRLEKSVRIFVHGENGRQNVLTI